MWVYLPLRTLYMLFQMNVIPHFWHRAEVPFNLYEFHFATRNAAEWSWVMVLKQTKIIPRDSTTGRRVRLFGGQCFQLWDFWCSMRHQSHNSVKEIPIPRDWTLIHYSRIFACHEIIVLQIWVSIPFPLNWLNHKKTNLVWHQTVWNCQT